MIEDIKEVFAEYGKKPNQKIIDFLEDCRQDLDYLSYNEARFRYDQENQSIEDLEKFFNRKVDGIKLTSPYGTIKLNKYFITIIQINLAKYRTGQREYKKIEKDWIFNRIRTFFELLKRYDLSNNKRYILMSKIFFRLEIYFFQDKNESILDPYDIDNQELIKTQFKLHFLKKR